MTDTINIDTIDRRRILRTTGALVAWVAANCCLTSPASAQPTPNHSFRIAQLPGDPVPLPADGYSVRQINGLWHDGVYYVYADVIGWDNPAHPASYGSSIGAYSSPDGRKWKYHGLVVSGGEKGTWDYGGVATQPGAVKFKDKFYVAYSGRAKKNGRGARYLGLAVSSSPLGPFTKIPSPKIPSPIFPAEGHAGKPPCYDDPCLVTHPDGDKLYLYYRHANWIDPTANTSGAENYSIRLRTTEDPEQGWSESTIVVAGEGGRPCRNRRCPVP